MMLELIGRTIANWAPFVLFIVFALLIAHILSGE